MQLFLKKGVVFLFLLAYTMVNEGQQETPRTKGGIRMKVIKLYGMVLENFKGISKLDVNFEGGNVDIFADNGGGKTTLFDAFLWVLFGKDSNNRKDFQIKTIVNGEEMHNVNHSVEIELEVDGHKNTLKRTFKEVYKKSRGGIEKTFNGHKTEYEFNGVPCNEKEYKAKVDSIVNEEVFKLITNPIYFNDLKWQEQRKLLFELVNDVSVDPLSVNEDLKPLEKVLEQFSPEEAKAVYTAKRKKIKEQVETIPSRIEELQRMNNSSTEGADEAEKEIEKIELYVDDLRNQIARIKSGSVIVQYEREIEDNKRKLYDLEQQGKGALREELDRVLTKMEEVVGNGQILRSKKQGLEFDLADKENTLRSHKGSLNVIKQDQDSLREKFYEERDKELDISISKECPTCKQSLPHDEIEKANHKALTDFEDNKKEVLASMQVKGKELGLSIKEAQESIAYIEASIERDKAEIAEIDNKINTVLAEHKKMTEKRDALKLKLESVVDSEEKLSVRKIIKELTVKLAEAKANADEMVTDLENDVSIHLKKRNDLNLIVGQKVAIKSNATRIAELQKDLQEYIIALDDADRIIYLLSEYNRTKVEALSDSINNLFSITKFKLFNQLVNGEYEETCEAMHNGIPYNKNLNTAAKINVGLDIINVLSNHYRVNAPIFIDNAESVTKFIDIKGQCVRLYVQEGQKTLLFKEVTQ